MLKWERALDVFASSAGDQVLWMLVGSAATRLQGASVEPGDVDVLVHPDTTDEDMQHLAEAFTRYAVPKSDTAGPDHFLSALDEPLVRTQDGSWLFGRWVIEGCKLEMARIRVDLGPAAIVETMGSAVWDTRRTVQWRGHRVPVVPLEVQLATIVSRQQTDRECAVRATLADRGPDLELLRQAMADRGAG